VESGERGGEVLSPGPGAVDADVQPALAAGDPGGDVQESVAQGGRFGARGPRSNTRDINDFAHVFD
jgi:hypothetical protein